MASLKDTQQMSGRLKKRSADTGNRQAEQVPPEVNGAGHSAAPKKSASRNPKAAARIATRLRREIVTGSLHMGEKLLPERILREQFQVSRPTLREAMRMLESESLIRISRGQHGGARVQKLDIEVTARQVGVYLQMEGTTLADVLQARTIIEAPAAGLIAAQRSLAVVERLQECVAEARRAYDRRDPRGQASSQGRFSEILTTHCHNKTISLFATLLHDIIRRQMTDVAVRTHMREGGRKMQWLAIRGREKLIELIVAGKAEEAEQFWRVHLEGSARVIQSAFRAQMPIDVLQELESGAG
jgi:DNA-binding FadR family transcriptional regulator